MTLSLSSEQFKALGKLFDRDKASPYQMRVKLNTIRSLRDRNMVQRISSLGDMAFPHNSQYKLTPLGRQAFLAQCRLHRVEFTDERLPLALLRQAGIIEVENGHLLGDPSKLCQTELDAIAYLCDEWDFSWMPLTPALAIRRAVIYQEFSRDWYKSIERQRQFVEEHPKLEYLVQELVKLQELHRSRSAHARALMGVK